jgi:sec-independent protein translocase protein TatB
MLDLGWSELFLIGVVALVVIGPKDLPKAMRGLAKMMSRARGLSREFQDGVSEMMREAELDELRRKMEQARTFDLAGRAKEMVDPTGTLSEHFDPAEFELGRKPANPKAPPVNAEPVNAEPVNAEPVNAELGAPPPAAGTTPAAPALNKAPPQSPPPSG